MSVKRTKYLRKYKEIDAPGLDAINERELEIYGNQEATHIATAVSYEMGGKDPLWAVEYFKSEQQEKHLHYLTLGYTNLFYDAECADDATNGFGFEITFRHLLILGDPEKPAWAAAFLQNIAKYVFKYQNGFDEYHYMSANGPFRAKTDSDITAFVFAIDSEFEELDTPHGHLKFLQLFGITTQEYQAIEDKKYTAKELIEKHKLTNPLLITDLFRKS